ncbi:hypothetical protein [Agromyces allii]|uniref:Uncharacterized protein n=1 Tax=Agromyces allii TaxID=393607 RepID=A0ABN2QM72_9MICO|nr:hypothetical protein [Agromyces allii]
MTDFVDPLEEPLDSDRDPRNGEDWAAQDAAAARYDAERREAENAAAAAEKHQNEE